MLAKYSGLYWLCFIFVLYATCNHAHAQQYTLADTPKIYEIMHHIYDSANNYMTPQRRLQLVKEADLISRPINYAPGIAQGLNISGAAYRQMGDMKKAMGCFTEALKISRENHITALEAQILGNLGILYSDIGMHDKELDCYKQELVLFKEMDHPRGVAGTYVHIGLFYSNIKYYDEAIKYYLLALTNYTNEKDTASMEALYTNLGESYIEKKNYPLAFAYLFAAAALSDSLQDNATSNIYCNLGLCYSDVDKPDSALYCYKRALDTAISTSDKEVEMVVLNNIGELYLKEGKLSEAEPKLKKSLQIATMLSSYEDIQDACKNLANLCSQKNDFPNAYRYQKMAADASDSLKSLEKTRQFARLAIEMETREVAEKNKTLQQENNLQKLLLRQKNIVMYLMLGGTFLVLVIGVLLIRQYRLRAAQQRMELEQKQLLAQINPHFIFNCLNSIQQFVVQNDIINANRYLADFALLMRQTLDNSKDGIISLQREMEYLENYLSFEHMRFEDKFTYTITADDNIDIETVEIPSMIIQPFVENAVRHGLCNLQDRKGILKITFYKKEGFLYCSIDDNGIGMAEARKIKEQTFIKYQSLGMELTRQRLALVSKLHSEDYKISIIHKEDASQASEGTTIIIKFPLQV